MRYKPIDLGIDLCKPTEGYQRTPGFHASDLYNAWFKATEPKRYDKKLANGEPAPMDLAKMEIGTCFEEVLEPRLQERLVGARPGEFTAPHDIGCPYGHEAIVMGVPCRHCAAGTIFSPDYFFEDNGETVLGEFKCSYYSTQNAPIDPKFNKWTSQCKLYSHWLGLRRTWLVVMFVAGDYKPPSPKLLSWELKFTEQELRDEYDVLVKFARKKGLLEGWPKQTPA